MRRPFLLLLLFSCCLGNKNGLAVSMEVSMEEASHEETATESKVEIRKALERDHILEVLTKESLAGDRDHENHQKGGIASAPPVRAIFLEGEEESEGKHEAFDDVQDDFDHKTRSAYRPPDDLDFDLGEHP